MPIVRSFLAFSFSLGLFLQACGDDSDPAPGTGGSGGGFENCQPDEEVVARPLCEDWCQVAVTECGVFPTPVDACGQICECVLEEVAAFSEECGAAWEAEYECAAALDCDEFVAYRVGNDSPCRAAADETIAACEGLLPN